MISIGQAEYLGANAASDNGFELDDIADYLVSTAVDIGVTTWNSLVPEATGWEADTGNILHGLNEDMGQFYDNNKELVNASSFIGGLFVPMLAASKAMKVVTTAKGWVGKATPMRTLAAKEASYTAAAKQALVDGGRFGAEYRSARSKLRWVNMGQGLTEGAVYEASLVTLMNDHAYMENNYTLTDAAIGVTLGALAGPVRMWQGTKVFNKAAAEIELTQQAKMHNPVKELAPSPSKALQMESSHVAYAAEVNLDELSASNRSIQQAIMEKAQQRVVDQVAKMSHSTLREEGDNLVKKFRLLENRDPLDDPAIGLISKMEMDNPGTFAGATRFIPQDASKATEEVTKLVMQQTKTGTHFESGSVARNLLATNVKIPAKLDFDTIPEVFSIKLADDGAVDISMATQELTKKDRAWLAGYLVSPSIKSKTIRFDSSFKVSKKALAEEAAAKQLEIFGPDAGFIPYDDLLDVMQETGRISVLDPFFGRRLLGEIEAKSVARAGSMPSLTINEARKLSEPIGYKPFAQSSPMADKSYLESLYAAKRATPVGGVYHIADEGMAALPAVQALHATNIGNPAIKITMGDTTLNGHEAIASWIWKHKQEGVWAGLDARASTAEIAVHMNMPVDTVDAIVAWGRKDMPRDPELRMYIYTDAAKLESYKKPAIAIVGENLGRGRASEIETTKILDLDTMKGIHDEVVASSIVNYTSTGKAPEELASLLADVYQSDSMGLIRDNLGVILSDISAKSKLLASSDMSLRTLGPLADHITTIGRTAQHYANQHISRAANAIEPTLQAVEKDAASAYQFAQLEQAIQALDPAVAKRVVYHPKTRKIIWKTGKDQIDSLKILGRQEDIVLTDRMDKFIQAYLPIMREQHGFLNVMQDMAGNSKSAPNGLWFPYETINKKLIAYKIPKNGIGEPTIITAHTEGKLKELVTAAEQKFGDTHRIITRAEDSIAFNNLNYQSELNPLRRADAEMRKVGIAVDEIVPGTEAIRRFRQALKDDIWAKHRRMQKLANADVFSVLDDYARQETKFAKSGVGTLLQKMQKPLSTAEIVQRTMLNKGFDDYSPIMDVGNNIVSATFNTILHKVDLLVKDLKGGGADDWVKFRDSLKANNIPIPYTSEHEFVMARRAGEALNTAEQRIAQVQSLDVLFRLRFGELAHGAITVLSTPVILAGELAHQRMPMKSMVQGIKFMYGNSAEGTRVLKKAKELGYVKGVVAESKEAIENLHVKDITKNTRLMGWLTKASDASEDFVREWSFSTGYVTAKEKFPTATEQMLMAHAQAFTQRTMGNYVAKQRPVMFQGALGSMLGLYQTFMVTMGQNMFRYLEAGDARAIKTLFGAQAGMFGVESLPFFQDFNQVMGAYMSDDHMDIRATTYEAANGNPKLAEYILYGLPSAAFGNSLYTRAAWQPRTPFDESGPRAGLSISPTIWNTMMEGWDFANDAVTGVADSFSSGGGLMDAKSAVMQAAAAQSVWRPLARAAELEMGTTFDKKGEVISNPSDVYSFSAVAARVLGTRPLKETVLRNAKYATSFYNSVDRDLKARTIKQIRRAAVYDPNPNRTGELMMDYLDAGGSYKGWKDIYNRAAVSTKTPFASRLLEFSEKQPAMQALINEYAN